MLQSKNIDTIAAIATPPGKSAIGIIRLSGSETLKVLSGIFRGADLNKVPSHTVHFGKIVDDQGLILDEVLVSIFRSPRSYTGEDVAEISCHGSPFILKEVLGLLNRKGVRQANPGEFTLRAFMNGKLDLSQAEAVADIIDSESAAAHRIAMNQMRGGFSEKMAFLRDNLVNIVSLFELELDFAEEDVEFATNKQLLEVLETIKKEAHILVDSFRLSNAIRKGVSVVIAGRPNAGKSTLLNTLVNEERAITSEIPGTTRDYIEDMVNIGGIDFRFMDTAGISENSSNHIEAIGIERALEKARSAEVLIYLFDVNSCTPGEAMKDILSIGPSGEVILTANKLDKASDKLIEKTKSELMESGHAHVMISSKFRLRIEELKTILYRKINLEKYGGEGSIIANARHYAILSSVLYHISEVEKALDAGLSKDLISVDLKNIMHLLGEITGQITNDEILQNIFSRFCIGK